MISVEKREYDIFCDFFPLAGMVPVGTFLSQKLHKLKFKGHRYEAPTDCWWHVTNPVKLWSVSVVKINKERKLNLGQMANFGTYFITVQAPELQVLHKSCLLALILQQS